MELAVVHQLTVFEFFIKVKIVTCSFFKNYLGTLKLLETLIFLFIYFQPIILFVTEMNLHISKEDYRLPE